MKIWAYQILPMSHKIEIKKGAFVISDAHFSPSRPELFFLIEEIYFEKLQPSQIILMGDIFDALFGSIEYTYKNNQKMINMLNEISQEIEIIYLEGNHDFNLKKVFPQIKTFSIQKQPVECNYEDKKIYLAHGDFEGPLGYRLYTSIVRNALVLPLLKVIDNLSKHSILNYVYKHLAKKEDCNEFTGFRIFISRRIVNNYNCDYFIEGHYHQNKQIKFKNFIYMNLAAFACNQRYFIVKSLKDKELLEENIFSKGL